MYKDKIEPFIPEIVRMRVQGRTVKEIADFLQIDQGDLSLEVFSNEELYNAWYKGEAYLIDKLESALYKAALGQYVEEEEEITTDGGKGQTTTFKKKRRYVQSVPAAIKALEVLHSRKWANSEVESRQIEIVLPKELRDYSE